MHYKGTKRNVNANEPPQAFDRPLLHWAVRCTKQTVTINSAQPDFDIEISHCSFSVVLGHYSSFLCQMKENKLCNNDNHIL